MADHNYNYTPPMPPWIKEKYNFQVGDAVTYSVYPNVINGLGMVSRYGVLSVGATYMDVTAAGLSDWCTWDHIYDIAPRETE